MTGIRYRPCSSHVESKGETVYCDGTYNHSGPCCGDKPPDIYRQQLAAWRYDHAYAGGLRVVGDCDMCGRPLHNSRTCEHDDPRMDCGGTCARCMKRAEAFLDN